MEIVAAIDSFKGSMTSVQAGKAAAKGIHKVDPEAKVHVRPLADGGEGTVEALVSGMNGTIRKVSVTGPIGKNGCVRVWCDREYRWKNRRENRRENSGH